MDYIAKARDLGMCLAETEEFAQLKAAEESIRQDADAWKAFQEYQNREQSLTAGKLFGKVTPEKESIAHIDHRVRLMNRYAAIRGYFNKQQAFEKLIAIANLAITTSLYGIPDAQDLPLPESLKDLAQQILNKISDGVDMTTMEIPEDFKLPFNPENL